MIETLNKVKKKEGRTIIEDVKMPERPNSVISAYCAVARAVEEPILYEMLMGGSGQAFRLQVHDTWCPSSPHTFCGAIMRDLLDAHTPFKLKLILSENEDETTTDFWDPHRDEIKACIDKGVPVLFGSLEMGVIVGYEESTSKWIVVHPMKSNTVYSTLDFIPWGVEIPQVKNEIGYNSKEQAFSVLRTANMLYHKKQEGDYYLGENAWRYWIKTLTNYDSKKSVEDINGNFWIYRSLVSARKCAHYYLTQLAEGALSKYSQIIKEIATDYLDLVKTLQGKSGIDEIAPKPGQWKNYQWTDTQRLEQIKRLNEALSYETAATQKLEQFLNKID